MAVRRPRRHPGALGVREQRRQWRRRGAGATADRGRWVGIDHPSGIAAGGRVRHLSSRPATEDGSLTAEGFTILDAVGRYRWRWAKLGVQVDNLLDTEWREVQFANSSRLANEPAAADDIHFTPGWPRTVVATVTIYR